MPRYLQTIAFKTLVKSDNVTTTKLTEYSIYYSTESEFIQYVRNAWKENPDAITCIKVGSRKVLTK